VLLLETGGERVTTLGGAPEGPGQGLGPDTVERALRLAVEQAGASMRRLVVGEWNGEPVLDSAAAPLLEAAGFRREALVYVWD
jgi:hypothetical protein